MKYVCLYACLFFCLKCKYLEDIHIYINNNHIKDLQRKIGSKVVEYILFKKNFFLKNF